MLITVTRTNKTSDGIFGNLQIDGNPFKCVTLERLGMEILAGVYNVEFTFSPDFNRVMPLIDVPGRTGCRFHWANFPAQLLGCIALGEKVDGDAIDESVIAFNQLYAIIQGQEGLKLKVVEDYV
jgi:hypothetical protein